MINKFKLWYIYSGKVFEGRYSIVFLIEFRKYRINFINNKYIIW